ncbi:hypothetical protein UFOVP232_20 [uncultured Caudovirales phage]|uniref:Uncharacterized protein n=1 Tax=uncultured Caudovirales phage TaxID=2100421 RepID=A0A6J7WTH0_9CAUD|nr:hypothetical protein UFOVP232_20 [uncultured Caudovirales phage]
METNAIIDAVMQQLVTAVADEVIRKLKAEGMAQAALDPETLAQSLRTLLQTDSDIREEVRVINDDRFNEVEGRLDNIENDDRDDTFSIDADDADFDAAVMQVLRNNI